MFKNKKRRAAAEKTEEKDMPEIPVRLPGLLSLKLMCKPSRAHAQVQNEIILAGFSRLRGCKDCFILTVKTNICKSEYVRKTVFSAARGLEDSMNERQRAKLPNFSDAAARRETAYSKEPAITRERCIMATGDGLERTRLAMQQWSERAKSTSEKRTVEILAKRVEELIGTVNDFTRGL
jgi:hypothetical protein